MNYIYTHFIVKGLQALNITHWNVYYYYRSRGGAEVDIIIDGTFGVLHIEVKYGSTINRGNLKSLTATSQ